MSLIRKITNSGTNFTFSSQEKRNIILSNYISLVCFFSSIGLLVGRFFFAFPDYWLNIRIIVASLVFTIPIFLNRLGLINFSRITICWLPPLFVLLSTIIGLQQNTYTETSSYVGLRLFMISFTCFPFIVFNLSDRLKLLVGILGPYLTIFLFNPILNAFDVGYYQKGLQDSTYYFNDVRAIVACLVIGSSSFFLKRIIEHSEKLTNELLRELAEKNKLIQQQASTELSQLNQQLFQNLQQLREREFTLNRSQRIAKLGSWDYRMANNSLYWSDEMYNVFGLERNFEPKPGILKEVLGDQASQLFDEAHLKLLKTGNEYDLTVKTKTPLGYIKWLRVQGFPVRNGNSIIGSTGICHDVTLYKEAEELVRTSEHKYRSLFEQASDPILVTDFKGNLIDANAALCSLFGYSKGELMQLNISSLLDADQLRTSPIQFDLLLKGEHIHSERTMIGKHGERMEVEANVKKFGDVGIMALIRDVTELRKAQREIQRSESRFRTAFDSSAIGMALVSLEGRWLRVNRQLCSTVGYSEEEMLALSFQDLTHPDDLATDNDLFYRCLNGEMETYTREKRYIHKSGAVVWINVSVSLIRGEKNQPIYFVSQIENITDRKTAERQKDYARYLLNERIKELTTLYRSGQVLTNESMSPDEVMQEVVNLLPPGWQYPEITAAKIVCGDKVFTTANHKEGGQKQSAAFTLPNNQNGLIEVTYLEDRPIDAEGPFMTEERDLINMLAEMVRAYFMRKHEAEALRKSNKQVGELKLMALRSVMNPHFIFNVLNSIQFYIAKNDRLNAINYLSTFSKLIRSVLTHSVNNKIKLSDEIALLKNYVQLEMTRFENKFEFVLQIDPEVDIDSIEIPSLLIQPYVENAILHGLYNKTGKGVLKISVRLEEEDEVVFEVEDDGIGRAAARKLRQQNAPMHKSMGIKLTEERLKLINEHHNVSFEINDLSNDEGPAGTQVIIWVKVEG